MDLSQLIAAGLNPQQAGAYALLLERGSVQPKTVATELGLTRTNAYKLLDKLVEMRLAKRKEISKKFSYSPTSPLALTNITYAERNRLVRREQAVQKIMDDLLRKYYKHNEKPAVTQVSGFEAVVNAYHQQAALQKNVYFVRSLADVNSLGFDAMHNIRIAPAHYGRRRYGITPDGAEAGVWEEGDKKSNLERTWIRNEDYTAPVEWSVSGDMLLIVLFGSEPHAVIITNPVIADAFRQIFQLLATTVRAMKYYQDLPRD